MSGFDDEIGETKNIEMAEETEESREDEEPLTIAFHHDADGISSAVMYLIGNDLAREDVVMYAPDSFGDVKDNPDVVLDMTPDDPEWGGICFDHHNQHPPKEEREYELIFDYKPTSAIVYDYFQKNIPEDESWKVTVGTSGDQQWDKTPDEIWEHSPQIRATSGWTKMKYGDLDWYEQAMHSMLSTLINAPARMGETKASLEVLDEARKPMDVLFDEYLRSCRSTIKNEMRSAQKEAKFIDFGNLIYLEYESNYRLYLATQMFNSTGKKTVVSINVSNGKFSTRGPMAKRMSKEFNERGIQAGGHQGYCGGKLSEKSHFEFRDIISELAGEL